MKIKHDTWSVDEAKARLGEIIERARTDGPQTITKGGKKAAVVVSAREWGKKAGPKSKPKAKQEYDNLADFLLNSPARGSGIEKLLPDRKRDFPRKIDL